MLFKGPKIYTLSSGSSGNSVFISSGETSILADAGISMRATEKALNELGCSLRDIDAVIITHEHSDHIKGLEMISSHYGIPIYIPDACVYELSPLIDRSLIHPMPSEGFELGIGDIGVAAFPTPHDSAASVGYVFEIQGRRFGLATDIGYPTKRIADALCGCEKIIIEANYDRSMLENGPYPYPLRQRIASNRGHLDNRDSAKLIAYLALEGGADRFLLAHLSDKNNTPECALETVLTYLERNNIKTSVEVASRKGITCLVDQV